MSNYPSLIPTSITTDSFTYNGAKFTITASSIERSEHNPYQYANGFYNSNHGITSGSIEPPHWVKLSCDKAFITDEYIFTAVYDVVVMTIKDYNIEVSMDGSKWDIVYKGSIPNTSEYTCKCSFTPVVCKNIRIKTLTTYDYRGYRWAVMRNTKVYGKLLEDYCIYNNDNNSYEIKKEIPTQ